MIVTVRELRLRLSEYLREANGGETIVVTNRGMAVAELRGAGLGNRALRERRSSYEAADGTAGGERVGVRALKSNLPHYLGIVRSGRTVMVTDRDEVTAELRPVALDLSRVVIPDSATAEEAALMRRALVEDPPPPEMMPLLLRGEVIYKGRFRVFPPRVKSPPGEPTLSDFLREMRESSH